MTLPRVAPCLPRGNAHGLEGNSDALFRASTPDHALKIRCDSLGTWMKKPINANQHRRCNASTDLFVADLQTSIAELDGVLAHTAFLKPYQFKVLSCAPGECVLKILFQLELERPGGLVSGMTLMGAGDVAMSLAIMTLRGVAETWVTTHI